MKDEQKVSEVKKVKNLQMGESIRFAGISWSKFAEDGTGNAYMLADDKVGVMYFGETNNWKHSPIRERLNGEFYKKVISELGEDSLITIDSDLFSHDGLKDYGSALDYISLLTYDLYRNNRKFIKVYDYSFWTCTPTSTISGYSETYVELIGKNDDVNRCDCEIMHGVRPFIILKSDIEIELKQEYIVKNRKMNVLDTPF